MSRSTSQSKSERVPIPRNRSGATVDPHGLVALAWAVVGHAGGAPGRSCRSRGPWNGTLSTLRDMRAARRQRPKRTPPDHRWTEFRWLRDQRASKARNRLAASGASALRALLNHKDGDLTAIQAHIGGMSESGHRSCKCGAVYDRSEHIAEAREISSFECAVCGETIENWNSAWVPRYRFIACPARDAD